MSVRAFSRIYMHESTNNVNVHNTYNTTLLETGDAATRNADVCLFLA